MEPKPAVRIEGLTKAFGPKTVLAGVDLDVREGETVAVIGPSGSGKTTLLRLINHLEIPTAGFVHLGPETIGWAMRADGSLKPASEKHLARQRCAIGFVFQRFNLFPHLNALDNVAIGLVKVHGASWRDARARAAEELAKVFLSDHIAKRPNQLSGGQQQRVAIARATAADPAIILFDEPTSALDPELVREVLDVIRALASAGRTMMIVTHEMRFARDVAHRVVFMDQGAIVEQGPPADLFDRPGHDRTRRFLDHFDGIRAV